MCAQAQAFGIIVLQYYQICMTAVSNQGDTLVTLTQPSHIPHNIHTSGVTIGPADPALQGAPFQGGTKLLENVGHFSEILTVILAKVRVLG